MRLSIISLMIFPFSFAVNALSATTAQVIQGNTPRFNTTIESDINNGNNVDFLGVKYNGADYYKQSDLTAILAGSNFDAKSKKPADFTFTKILGTPLTADIVDPDGDADTPTPIVEQTTGSVALDWYYKNGSTETKMTSTQINMTFCQLASNNILPYVKVGGNVTLSTQYGVPRSQSYPDAIISVTKSPKNEFMIPDSAFELPIICYIQPEITYGGLTDSSSFKGPNWDLGYGFLQQTNRDDNFPSTGAHNLYFDLVLLGVDATSLNWTASTLNGVTATITPQSKTKARIKLTGPVASSINSSGTATAFVANQNVDIKGSDGTGVKIEYNFILKKWFINRDTDVRTSADASWCTGLAKKSDGTTAAYILPDIPDLTNGNNDLWTGGLPGLASQYQRRVGGGFFAEWGNMYKYSGARFDSDGYWTSRQSLMPGYTSKNYVVASNIGHIGGTPAYPYHSLCMSNGN